MLKIGILGGTFNPPHFGHISLAIDMMEAHQLDEILVTPAFINPFKKKESQTASHHREAMIKKAIKGINGLKLCQIELENEGPSYTINTLSTLYQYFKRNETPFKLYLILGEDSAESFFNWNQPEEIIKLSTLIVGKRSLNANFKWEACMKPELMLALKEGLTPTRYLDISSTDIRNRIKKGQYVEHLIPLSVWRYIQKHRLYL